MTPLKFSEKSLGRRGFLLGALVLPLAGCASQAVASRQEARQFSRKEIKAMLRQEAPRYGVPVALALAMAHAESNFDAGARSHKGARGVMQIMPATALGEYGVEKEMLWDPRINIRIGLHFMNRLLHRYRGRIDLALSYYNGGSRVGDLPNARVIPATAKYVARVRRLQRHYAQQTGEGV